MKPLLKPNLSLALVHYPVTNKKGDEICSAVTNLDLHDIARVGRTYGVSAYYVVTPLADQQVLVNRISAHWTTGNGGKVNPARAEALKLIRVSSSLQEAIAEIIDREGILPKVVATTARRLPDMLSHHTFREMLKDGLPYLLVFGTAWGLSPQMIKEADYLLEPISGGTDYNHLSVRSAVSILLDRVISGRIL